MVMPLRVVPTPIPSQDELDLQERSIDHSGVLATTSVLLMPPNKARTGFFFVNKSAVAMSLALGRAASIDTGIYFNSGGGSLEINKTNLWRGAVYGISASGSGNKFTLTEIETRYAY